MNNCQSCGMPMEKPEDYGGGRVGNSYCRYCTDVQGNLLPKEVVQEKMVQFQMQSLGKTRNQAEVDVKKHMDLMPAWKLGVPQSPVESPSETFSPVGLEASPGPVDQPAKPAEPPSDEVAFSSPPPAETPAQSGQPSQLFSAPPRKEPSLAKPPMEEDRVSGSVGPSVPSAGPSNTNISESPLKPPLTSLKSEPGLASGASTEPKQAFESKTNLPGDLSEE